MVDWVRRRYGGWIMRWVEPELNIGRVLVGLATVEEARTVLWVLLLQDGLIRAAELSDQDRFEVHVAVRDTESRSIVDALEATGFGVVRSRAEDARRRYRCGTT